MKKQKFTWWRWHNTQYAFCDNSEFVCGVHTYTGTPHISFSLSVAEYCSPVELKSEYIWERGRKMHKSAGSGWYYRLSAFVANARLILVDGDNELTNRGPCYASKNEAVKAGLHEFVAACDAALLIPAQYARYNYRRNCHEWGIGSEQLAYYLCMAQWEPMWQLLEEVTRYDDWLTEVRAPKKTILSEQTTLF